MSAQKLQENHQLNDHRFLNRSTTRGFENGHKFLVDFLADLGGN
jgi:hypothetical protein